MTMTLRASILLRPTFCFFFDCSDFKQMEEEYDAIHEALVSPVKSPDKEGEEAGDNTSAEAAEVYLSWVPMQVVEMGIIDCSASKGMVDC